jgi:Spy/CpxP family protein refolding chaperone
VDAVFRNRRRQLDDLQRDVRERFDREQRDLRQEIRTLLTPEQQVKFDQWVEPLGQGRRGRGPRPPD